jgi:hypothetical protein
MSGDLVQANESESCVLRPEGSRKGLPVYFARRISAVSFRSCVYLIGIMDGGQYSEDAPSEADLKEMSLLWQVRTFPGVMLGRERLEKLEGARRSYTALVIWQSPIEISQVGERLKWLNLRGGLRSAFLDWPKEKETSYDFLHLWSARIFDNAKGVGVGRVFSGLSSHMSCKEKDWMEMLQGVQKRLRVIREKVNNVAEDESRDFEVMSASRKAREHSLKFFMSSVREAIVAEDVKTIGLQSVTRIQALRKTPAATVSSNGGG